MEFAIEVENLSKTYAERIAVDQANFQVKRGSICGFVGPNGSGKTTSIRAILGLIKPSEGEIKVFQSHDPVVYLQKIGAMIEGPAFYPLLSGISNLKVLAELAGISKDKCDELIALVGLGERKKSKFKTYSLGMKQRLGIAAALLPNPDLLILDEPTNGLDPNGILEIRNLIKTLALSGKTIFVSSHLLSELEAICDSFVMIKSGKIIYAGPKEGLISEVESESFTVEPEYKVDLASLVGIIGNAGYQFEIKDNLVEVFASSNFRAHINRLAFSDGITLRNLSAKTNSLEDTFFEMVLN